MSRCQCGEEKWDLWFTRDGKLEPKKPMIRCEFCNTEYDIEELIDRSAFLAHRDSMEALERLGWEYKEGV